jgi:hypothetical protein
MTFGIIFTIKRQCNRGTSVSKQSQNRLACRVRLKTGSLDLKTGSLHRTETTFGRFGPLGLVLKQRLGLWATPTLIEQIWTLTEQKKKESPTPIHRNLDDHDYDTYSATIRFQKEIWTTTKSGCINKTILPPPEIQLRPEKHFHSSTGDTISTRKTIFCRYHLTISQRRLLSDDLTPSQTSVAAVFVAVVSLQLQRLPTKLRCRCRLVGESTHATT